MKKEKKTKESNCLIFAKKIFLCIAIILIDQLSKLAIRSNLTIGINKQIIPGILDFTYLQNTGAVWGILKNNNAIFIWISIIAIGFILYFYDSFPSPKWTMHLILAGIIGNLMDRFFLGFVTDFIDFKFWPVFNVADMTISISVAIILAYAIKEEIIASRKRRS